MLDVDFHHHCKRAPMNLIKPCEVHRLSLTSCVMAGIKTEVVELAEVVELRLDHPVSQMEARGNYWGRMVELARPQAKSRCISQKTRRPRYNRPRRFG